MADEVCPPFGTGSVDFNAVHQAAMKGKNLEDAIAKATTGGPPLADAPAAAPEPAPEPAPASPAAPAAGAGN